MRSQGEQKLRPKMCVYRLFRRSPYPLHTSYVVVDIRCHRQEGGGRRCRATEARLCIEGPSGGLGRWGAGTTRRERTGPGAHPVRLA